MKVVISGGTGFIGSQLVSLLTAKGHEAIVLTRNAKSRTNESDNVQYVQFDATKRTVGLDKHVDGADAVFNLAGESIGAERWTPERKQAILDSRTRTTKALVRAVKKAGSKPAVFISASAVGYYGARSDDESLDEMADPGSDFLASTCVEWEKAARPVEKDGVRLVLARFGVVLGEGGEALEKMILPFKLFAGGPVGSGEQWLSWIHIADLLASLMHVLEDDSISGPINVTAPDPVQNREFAKTVGRVLNRPAILPAPAFAVQLALGERADIVLNGQRVVPDRLLASGFRFKYDKLGKALRAILTG